MFKLTKFLSCILLIIGLVSAAHADSFIVRNIHVEGNQRVSTGTVLSYLPIKEGERFNSEQTPQIIRALYNTGFFSDVEVSSNNGILTVKVLERSVITAIHFVGNSKITNKQLLDALKQIGLSEGQVLNQAALSGLEQALVQQYYNLGCYNVNIKSEVTAQSRNRVIVNIKINEGPVAKIKSINVIGNTVFTEKELLKDFTLTPTNWFKLTFINHNDQYSKDKLEADLEKLRSYYMDRGYLKFNIDAVQVSLTPDKKHIYIVIHITEGDVYKIKGYSLSGDLLGQRAQIQKFIVLQKGEIFSRKKIMAINSLLEQFVGDYGYAMPDIKADPVINDAEHWVFINFKVDPGKRVYVRRISFSGNSKTDETVLRREMRQQEGAMYSLSKVNESKRRLANLGYIDNVDVKLNPVPGHSDQVDLDCKVKEAMSASATFNFGYSDADGFIYGASVSEQNFLGTGRGVSVQFNNSKYAKNYGLSYFNPYHTINNISLRFDAYAQTQDPGDIDLSSYTTDIYGASVTYGIPVSEYNRINLGYGYEYIKIKSDDQSPKEVHDFIEEHGSTFNQAKIIGGWSHNKLDRAIFPTDGFAQSLSFEAYLPVASRALSFYKANYNASWYYPLYKKFVLHANGEVGYGNGFGNTHGLPFFKNYYAGGMDTVRGFNSGSLGPRDSNGDPIGGNLLTDASLGIIIPTPLGDSIRTTAFVDIGNVYQTKPEVGQELRSGLRSAAGVQVEWRSPLGILRFSFAEPLKYEHGDDSHHADDKRFFDFAIGTSF